MIWKTNQVIQSPNEHHNIISLWAYCKVLHKIQNKVYNRGANNRKKIYLSLGAKSKYKPMCLYSGGRGEGGLSVTVRISASDIWGASFRLIIGILQYSISTSTSSHPFPSIIWWHYTCLNKEYSGDVFYIPGLPFHLHNLQI